MTKATEEKNGSKSDVRKKSARFFVTQRAALYHVATGKFCIAKVAETTSEFYEKYGPWDIFGGHIDVGETVPAEALLREIREEAGVRATIHSVLGARDFSGYGPDLAAPRLLVSYLALCETTDVTVSREHSEYVWLSAEEIAAHKEIKPWLKDIVAQAQARLRESEALAGWQRCLADFDNYKKRQAESAKTQAQYAAQDLVTRLLPVLDNFQASVAHVPAEHANSPWVTGLSYIHKQLNDVLAESGVAVMEVTVGDVFDPARHEAVHDSTDASENAEKEEEESADKKDSDAPQKIAKVVAQGYMMGDKVLRPARVVVK